MQPTGEPAKWIADSSRGERIGMDDIDRAVFDEIAEPLLQSEKAFARVDGGGGGFLQLLIRLPVLRRIASGTEVAHLNHVLRPCQVVHFEGPGIANAVVQIERAEVIGCKRDLPADAVAHAPRLVVQVHELLRAGVAHEPEDVPALQDAPELHAGSDPVEVLGQ